MRTIEKAIDIKNIDNQTEENCFYAILKSSGEYIKYVLNPSDNLIKFALRFNGNNIRFIPEEKKTEEICMLAAINGAPSNILPVQTEDIINVCELVAWVYEKSKEVRYKINNVIINNEMTNFYHKFSTSLFEDIDEYNQYYTNYGYNLKDTNIGKTYVKNGKIISFNNFIKLCPKVEKYEFNDYNIDILFKSKIFDNNLAKNIISKKPNLILKLDPKYISKSLIAEAIHNGLDVENYDFLAKIDFDTVIKAGSEHAAEYRWGVTKDISNEIILKLYELNGSVPDIFIKNLLISNYIRVKFPNEIVSSVEKFNTLIEQINRINKNIKSRYAYYDAPFDLFKMLFEIFENATNNIEETFTVLEKYPIFLALSKYKDELVAENGIEIIYKFFDAVQKSSLGEKSIKDLIDKINFKNYNKYTNTILYKYAFDNKISKVISYLEPYKL